MLKYDDSKSFMISENSEIHRIGISEADWELCPDAVRSYLTSLEDQNQDLWDANADLFEQNGILKKKIEVLEARLNKNPKNSSKPPSSGSPYDKPSPADKDVPQSGDDEKLPKPDKGKKKPGGKPGHKGHGPKLLEPDEVSNIMPEICSCGACDFDGIEAFYTHQELEIPEPELIVNHFVLHKGVCKNCGQESKGSIPQGHHTGFGPRLSAAVSFMAGELGNSRESIQTYFSSVLGVRISLGAIQKIIDRASQAIVPHYEKIAETARETEINHIDETSWFQNGCLKWLWVMTNTLVAFFMIHANRSKAAFLELVGDWKGILVSDGYGVYKKWVGKRQTCLAHLIRDARGLAERGDKELAAFGKKALAELQHLCHMAKVKPTEAQWLAFYIRFVTLILQNRDKDKDNEAGRFARRLEREFQHLFLFLYIEGVEPTNNFAERMIRFAVLWRKRSFGTQSEKGNRWVERILSVRQTCRINGVSTFHVLLDAFNAYLFDLEPDLSWIPAPPQKKS